MAMMEWSRDSFARKEPRIEMNNPVSLQPADPFAENKKMVYQQICTDLQSIEDFRLKLFGFLPIATAGSFLVTILTGPTILSSIFNSAAQKTATSTQFTLVPNLVLPFGIIGALITVALFVYEEENVLRARYLIDQGRKLEYNLGVGEMGQFELKQSHLFNPQLGSILMYSAVFAGWVCLALWFTLFPHVIVLLLSLLALVVAFLVSWRYASSKRSSITPLFGQNTIRVNY